jgi:hypothetical protein
MRVLFLQSYLRRFPGRVTNWRLRRRGIDSSNARDQSAMQPRRAYISAAVIADRAHHARLQISKGRVVRKAAGVDLGIMKTVRIAAADEDMRSPVAPHVRQPHRLVVEQKVRDRPGHAALKRESRRRDNPVELRSLNH